MALKMKGFCKVFRIVKGENQNKLWNVYLAELGPGIKSETAFPQQCFRSFSSFKKAMIDPDFKKFILFSEKSEIIGLAISSTNLQKIKKVAKVKVNLEKYKLMFPKEYEQRKIHYFPVTCILKEHQNLGCMNTLGETLIKDVNKNQGVAAFDFAEEKNAGLDEMIVYIAKETGLRPNAKITLIGKQTFVVIG